MSEEQIINRLIASTEYSALKALRPEFNLFSLLDDALREPAWSRIFAGILDSTLSHGLGNSGLREWLTLVNAESRSGLLPTFFSDIPPGSIIRTSVEYATPAGRRVDILVRILDSKHRVIGVVGIENKLDSPEQPSQITDYQAALSEVFPEAHRAIVYLTPDRREALTANAHSSCPCLPASYRTMQALCAKLLANAAPRVAALLDSLGQEIEASVLGEERMKTEAGALIKKLWMDPDHRKAMRLISECIPTPRRLWAGLLPKIKGPAQALRMELDDEGITYYPDRSSSPHEIKIFCGGVLGELTERLGFHLCYMLHCRERNPDVGSEFTLRLLAWHDSARP